MPSDVTLMIQPAAQMRTPAQCRGVMGPPGEKWVRYMPCVTTALFGWFAGASKAAWWHILTCLHPAIPEAEDQRHQPDDQGRGLATADEEREDQPEDRLGRFRRFKNARNKPQDSRSLCVVEAEEREEGKRGRGPPEGLPVRPGEEQERNSQGWDLLAEPGELGIHRWAKFLEGPLRRISENRGDESSRRSSPLPYCFPFSPAIEGRHATNKYGKCQNSEGSHQSWAGQGVRLPGTEVRQ